ncbi:cell adhesion molecule 2-like [Mytilus edulis]|uniref:cell adhesion molecule 2-like n=1 Tax=Mytilus edulis TaxID=6550 RepID=UPI0039EEF334
MEYSKSLMFSLVFCVFIINGIESISVQLQATPSEGILGSTSLELKCSYTTVPGEEYVTGVNIMAKINGQFKNVAIFYTPSLPLNATLTNDGNYLSNRVTLTNPTDTMTNSASMQFTQIACEDENEYMCNVAYAGSGGSTSANSVVANISVKGNPEEPDSVPSYVPSAGIEEGNNVVFTCTGNVGKPQGKFRWVRYRRDSNDVTIQETPYESETTTAVIMPGTCTFNGTSSLTLKMEQLDNNAVVRCQVVYQGEALDLKQQTNFINVYYSVRNVQVTKFPRNPTFAEGAEPITLTCSSDGNPALINTDYTWHKESNTSVTLGTGPTYVINNVVVNETDNYICVAQNSFNGKTFNMNNSIHIQIDFTTTTSTTTPSTTAESSPTAAPQLPPTDDGMSTGAIAGIAVGIAVIVIIIIIIVIFVLRRNNRGKDDSIDEPPEKPRNNLSFVDRKDALGDKNGPFNNHNIHYADLNFDDRPRSRKPLQLSQDSDLDHTPYAEVMMPRV